MEGGSGSGKRIRVGEGEEVGVRMGVDMGRGGRGGGAQELRGKGVVDGTTRKSEKEKKEKET